MNEHTNVQKYYTAYVPLPSFKVYSFKACCLGNLGLDNLSRQNMIEYILVEIKDPFGRPILGEYLKFDTRASCAFLYYPMYVPNH